MLVNMVPFVESAGVALRYLHRMHLALRELSAGLFPESKMKNLDLSSQRFEIANR